MAEAQTSHSRMVWFRKASPGFEFSPKEEDVLDMFICLEVLANNLNMFTWIGVKC